MKIVEVHPGYKKMTDDELEEHIRVRLGENPHWARRALAALYDEQTDEEKADPINVHHSNGRGFSPVDQEFLTSLAQQAQTGSLSQKQLGYLYRLLPKYSKQIVKMVRELERLEKISIPEVYFINVQIDNSMRMMKGYTKEMGFDSRHMPDQFILRDPSGTNTHLFSISEVYTKEGIAETFVYKAQIGDKEWPMYVTVGEEDYVEPEEIKNMGKAFGI